uniref:sensor histidine kinase n=1 Tax=Acetatifactor sp. TaxID=1872090 RepID=UPI0040567C28
MKPREEWDISLNKKINMILIVCGFIAFVILSSLYNIEPEFQFYVVAVLGLLVLCGAVYHNRREAKKKKILRELIAGCRERDAEEWKEAIKLLKIQDGYVAPEYRELLEVLQQTGEMQNKRFVEQYHAKQEFFGMWAHQIKTPIAALQLLLQSDEPHSTAECRQELFKIENYVAMALGYLRFDNMSSDLALGRYSLEGIIRQILKKYASVFIYSHLSVDLKNLNVQVLTDEKWLVFALEQVISNALKYTKEGGIRIEATQSAQGVELTISDTGIGIRQEDLPRIFEKGFTGYNGRIDKKASGLGLYLCKGILDKLGHDICIASKEQKGTTVTIRFASKEELERNLTKM